MGWTKETGQAPLTACLMLMVRSERHCAMHPYMQIIYNMLKTSHDINAASLADNSRVMAEATRILSSLATRVGELVARVEVVEQNQHALSGRLDADLTAVRGDTSRYRRERDSLNQRSLEDPHEIIVRGIPPAVQLEPFSPYEVADALQKSSSKASGHDGLSLPMIKLTLPYSLPHITNLFNISIATATFPTNWKKATIRSLAKSKVMTQPSDTRPIAQLPEFSKVLERLVHNQL